MFWKVCELPPGLLNEIILHVTQKGYLWVILELLDNSSYWLQTSGILFFNDTNHITGRKILGFISAVIII